MRGRNSKDDKEEKGEKEPVIPQEETFNVGPLSLLTKTVKSNAQVLISLRNNRKY